MERGATVVPINGTCIGFIVLLWNLWNKCNLAVHDQKLQSLWITVENAQVSSVADTSIPPTATAQGTSFIPATENVQGGRRGTRERKAPRGLTDFVLI
ncbi:hypothetical protein V6N11_071330 [Hibiscus sabdariffa]|uniref:Uncharacterized protein n=1 Tax=Hibiscus sabdariffa TaxID=183260 RepID=A0ABR2U011_9ROSI